MYVILSTAWNILGGYTGSVNFGTAGFFALGVYSSIVLWKAFHPPLVVMIVVGTLVAALSLGIANKFMEPIAGAVLGKILLLVFIILFIQKRPRGLFALKGRAVEA